MDVITLKILPFDDVIMQILNLCRIFIKSNDM